MFKRNLMISVHWEKGEQMGKPRMIGQFKPYTQNRNADMRFQKKVYLRNKNAAERGNRNDQRRSNSDS